MTDTIKSPDITIKRIKEESFLVNEALTLNPSNPIKIEIGQRLSFAINENLVSLTIRIYYRFSTDANGPILADINVQNVYELSDLKDFYIDSNEIKLPEQTITDIVGVSISHTRSLLAKNLLGTALQDNLPPIVNPREIARFFFPRMFESETSIQSVIDEAY